MVFCPYHLEEIAKTESAVIDGLQVSQCPVCKKEIPPIYLNKSQSSPLTVISAVGFSGHGKTVYFSSLFFLFDRILPVQWKGFHYLPIDPRSLNTVRRNMEILNTGELPPPSPQSFPDPTIILLNFPYQKKEHIIIIYDNGGEVFTSISSSTKYATYIKHSKTMTFFISIKDLEISSEHSKNTVDHEARMLLYNYIYGMAQLNAKTKKQDLIIILTKADEMVRMLPGHLNNYLRDGHKGIENIHEYIENLSKVSTDIEKYLVNSLKMDGFISLAKDNFASVRFCLVSSLGAAPNTDGRLPVMIRPLRVMDPILLAIEPSGGTPFIKKIKKIWGRQREKNSAPPSSDWWKHG